MTPIPFSIVEKKTGRVLSCGTTMHVEGFDDEPDRYVIQEQAPSNCYRDVDAGSWVQISDQPDENHVFDWTAHAWIDPRTLEEKRQALLAKVAAHRWSVETAGVTLANGVRVLTGRVHRDAITSMLLTAERAATEKIDFKAASGWVRLGYAELEALARVVACHVQACFSAEKAHHDAIACLATEAEIAAYQANAGWPSTDLPATEST